MVGEHCKYSQKSGCCGKNQFQGLEESKLEQTFFKTKLEQNLFVEEPRWPRSLSVSRSFFGYSCLLLLCFPLRHLVRLAKSCCFSTWGWALWNTPFSRYIFPLMRNFLIYQQVNQFGRSGYPTVFISMHGTFWLSISWTFIQDWQAYQDWLQF